MKFKQEENASWKITCRGAEGLCKSCEDRHDHMKKVAAAKLEVITSWIIIMGGVFYSFPGPKFIYT
jgi:hypothetical protein